MLDPKNINDVIHNMIDNLPPGLKQLPDELKQCLRETMVSTLQKMDLVTREEFDVQCRVLQRTREKLEALEKQLAEKSNSKK